MPHVALVPLTGLRVRDAELLQLGMSLPGLQKRAAALHELPSLGVLTLAGMLPADWSCSYVEPNGSSDNSIDELAAEIAKDPPDLVAVSALTASAIDAYRLGDALRQQGVPTVLGGLHATSCPQESGRHFDSVVVGEGEPVWHQLLADAASNCLQPVYRPTTPFDLAQAPLPRFDLLGNRSRPRMTLQTQRGCPLACEFCAASRLLGPFREKPLANVQAELAAMQQYTRRPWLELADDNTFAGTRDWRGLLDALGNSGARYFTESDWRVGERADLLRDLANSGCVQLLIGIESMHFRYPGMGKKQAEHNRIMEAVHAIQDAGIVANGCFIVGADGETAASLERMTHFLVGSPFAELQLTLQTPFPGTMLYQRLANQARILPDRDWSYYTLFDVTFQPDHLTVEELEAGFRRTMRAVFSDAENARRNQLRRQIWKRKDVFFRRRS